MGPSTPKAYGNFQYINEITDQFTKWTAVYLLTKKSLAYDYFRLFFMSVVIHYGDRYQLMRLNSSVRP